MPLFCYYYRDQQRNSFFFFSISERVWHGVIHLEGEVLGRIGVVEVVLSFALGLLHSSRNLLNSSFRILLLKMKMIFYVKLNDAAIFGEIRT